MTTTETIVTHAGRLRLRLQLLVRSATADAEAAMAPWPGAVVGEE